MGAAEQFMEAFKVGYGIGDRIQTKRADTAIYEGLGELQSGLERIRTGAIPADDPDFINDLLTTRAKINGQFASSSLTYEQLEDVTTQYQGLDNQIASAVIGSALPRWGSQHAADLLGNYIMSGDPETTYSSKFTQHPETGEPVLVVTPSDGDPVMISQQQAATMQELARGGGLPVWEINSGIRESNARYEQTVAGTRHQEALTTRALPVDIEAAEVGIEGERRRNEALPTGEEATEARALDREAAEVSIAGAERVQEALPTGEEARTARALDREATTAGIEQTERSTWTMATPEEARAARAASLEAAEVSTEHARLVLDTLPSGDEAMAARAADLSMSNAQRALIEAQTSNLPAEKQARVIEAAEIAYRQSLTDQVRKQTDAAPDAVAAEAMRAADMAAQAASTEYQQALTTDIRAQTTSRPSGTEAARIRDAELSSVRAGTALTQAQTDALVQETRAAARTAATADFKDLPAVQQLSDPDFLMSYIESDAIAGGPGVSAFLSNRTDISTQAVYVAKAAASAGIDDMGADEAIELTIRGVGPDAIPIAIQRQVQYERSQKSNNKLTAAQRAQAARNAIQQLMSLPVLDEYAGG